MKNLIVISTINKDNFDLFECVQNYKGNSDVLVVDTGSNDSQIEKTKHLCDKYGFYFHKALMSDYDFSGVKTAHHEDKYSNYEKYWFQQDTCFPKKNYELIFDKIKNNSPVAWFLFERSICPFDNEISVQFCKNHFNSTDYDLGIFGPIFGISRTDLTNIINPSNIRVECKSHATGMERGWAILFKKYNFKVHSLDGILTPSNWNTKWSEPNLHFIKVFLGRH